MYKIVCKINGTFVTFVVRKEILEGMLKLSWSQPEVAQFKTELCFIYICIG